MTHENDRPGMASPNNPNSSVNPNNPNNLPAISPENQSPMTQMATECLTRCALPFDGGLTAADMKAALEDSLVPDADQSAMLARQAQLLDALFYRLLVKGLTSPRWSMGDGTDYVDDDRVNLALRSQKQCRSTVETLAADNIKNDEQKEGCSK